MTVVMFSLPNTVTAVSFNEEDNYAEDIVHKYVREHRRTHSSLTLINQTRSERIKLRTDSFTYSLRHGGSNPSCYKVFLQSEKQHLWPRPLDRQSYSSTARPTKQCNSCMIFLSSKLFTLNILTGATILPV